MYHHLNIYWYMQLVLCHYIYNVSVCDPFIGTVGYLEEFAKTLGNAFDYDLIATLFFPLQCVCERFVWIRYTADC